MYYYFVAWCKIKIKWYDDDTWSFVLVSMKRVFAFLLCVNCKKDDKDNTCGKWTDGGGGGR